MSVHEEAHAIKSEPNLAPPGDADPMDVIPPLVESTSPVTMSTTTTNGDAVPETEPPSAPVPKEVKIEDVATSGVDVTGTVPEVTSPGGAPAEVESRVSQISSEDLETNLRSFITPDTVMNFSRKTAREELEKKLDLPLGSLLSRKGEVNDLLKAMVEEFSQANQSLSSPRTTQESDRRAAGSPPTSSSIGRKRPHSLKEEQADASQTSDVKSSPEKAAKQLKRDPQTKRSRVTADESGGSDSGSSEGDASEATSTSDADESDSSEVSSRRTRRTRGGRSGSNSAPQRRVTAGRGGVKATQGKAMTKAAFSEAALPLDCRIGTFEYKLEPRVFRTGSCGWYYGSKVPFTVGAKELTCVVGVNCTIVGSKTWKEGRASPSTRTKVKRATKSEDEEAPMSSSGNMSS